MTLFNFATQQKAKEILSVTQFFDEEARKRAKTINPKFDVRTLDAEQFRAVLSEAITAFPFVKGTLANEFQIKSQKFEKILTGEKTPKPSDMRGMSLCIRMLMRGVIETLKSNPDSIPDELPALYPELEGVPAFPNSRHREAERPSHRPGPQGRPCGQMHALQ